MGLEVFELSAVERGMGRREDRRACLGDRAVNLRGSQGK